MNNWHKIDLTELDTPALLIDKGHVEYNIQQAIVHAGGLHRLRPHVKTHKTLEVARMQIAAGITKFKCATIPEAEMLGVADAKDVLIAYQPQGPKIKRVYQLTQTFPETIFNVLIDNVQTAREIHEVFQEKDSCLSVYIDVNDGQNRTGIIPEFVEKLVSDCQQWPGIVISGIHCYDGHINMSSLDQRTETCVKAFMDVVALREKITQQLGRPLNMVAGGSGSFSVHATKHDVECSPGTFIFWDERYATDYQEQKFRKAAVVATRVISKTDTHTYCLDLGHKSVASEFPFPRVAFLGPHELEQKGHSEEHLIIHSAKPDALDVGQLLLAYPYHICPTVALYDVIHVVEKGMLIDQWKVIARDRKIKI